MAKVVKGTYDNENLSHKEDSFNGHGVYSIDPKIAMQNVGKSKTYSEEGLISPTYSHAPALGSVLQSPKDNTRVKVPSSKPNSNYWSTLPKVPPKKHLMNYGTVAPAENIQQVPMDDFLNSFPNATETSTHIPQPPVAPQVEPTTHQEKVDDAKFRANYRVKFSILRDAYPQMKIPEPTDDQSPDEIKAMYDQYVNRIMIDQSVEQNNVYLLILWLIIEVVGSRFFKLPFKGYTKNQFKYMSKYRMLLIELGERNQASGIGEGWPVELRILAMAAFNGVIFILVQMLANRVGMDGESADNTADQLREMINNFLTQNKGSDALKRAEQADADHPPPPSGTENDAPPMGDMGNILANLAGMFSGGGGGGGLGGLANLFGGGGGGKGNSDAPKAKPKMKKPTTFGARRKKSPSN